MLICGNYMLSLSMDDALSSVGNRDYLEHGEYIGTGVGTDRVCMRYLLAPIASLDTIQLIM